MAKAKNMRVTQEFLDQRSKIAQDGGFEKQKWIQFCEYMLKRGFYIKLYEATKTYSKYISVIDPVNKSQFKVRFSNHKPIKKREVNGDCDFFVGIANLKTTTTEQAIVATLQYFETKKKEKQNEPKKIDAGGLRHRPFERLRNHKPVKHHS